MLLAEVKKVKQQTTLPDLNLNQTLKIGNLPECWPMLTERVFSSHSKYSSTYRSHLHCVRIIEGKP